MGYFLKEMFGGQRRLTPDRELEPHYTGETIFTSRAPVPLVQRIAMALFAAGWVALSLLIFDWLQDYTGLLAKIFRVIVVLMIAAWLIVGIAALFAFPPFQSKRR